MIFVSTIMYRAINPKTSGQGHYAQLPFNNKGFQWSLAGVAMNNQHHCKPISKYPAGSQV
jgi:predicted protein tyrosine phosphatase